MTGLLSRHSLLFHKMGTMLISLKPQTWGGLGILFLGPSDSSASPNHSPSSFSTLEWSQTNLALNSFLPPPGCVTSGRCLTSLVSDMVHFRLPALSAVLNEMVRGGLRSLGQIWSCHSGLTNNDLQIQVLRTCDSGWTKEA